MARKNYRAHGTGCIEKRRNRFYLRNRINGKNHRTLLCDHNGNPVTSRADAEKRARELLPIVSAKTQAEVAFYVAEARKLQSVHNILLDDIWIVYLRQYDRPDSGIITEEGYHNALNLFIQWMKVEHPQTIYANDITREIAEEYFGYVWHDRRVSARTYNGYRHALSLIFTHIAEKTGLVGNPFARIKRKPVESTSHTPFTEEQVRTIFAGFQHGFFYEAKYSKLGAGRKREIGTVVKQYFPKDADEIRIVMLLCCLTGCRGQDACLLQWSNIDMMRRIIHFVPRKTAKRTGYKEVRIPMHPALYEALIDAEQFHDRNQPGEDYVCPNVAHRYMVCQVNVQDEIKKIIRCALKCETTNEALGDHRQKRSNRYSLHSFRHSFVTFCANAGVPLDVIAEMVGHTSSVMTRLYAHYSEESKRAAIQALPTLSVEADVTHHQSVGDLIAYPMNA